MKRVMKIVLVMGIIAMLAGLYGMFMIQKDRDVGMAFDVMAGLARDWGLSTAVSATMSPSQRMMYFVLEKRNTLLWGGIIAVFVSAVILNSKKSAG